MPLRYDIELEPSLVKVTVHGKLDYMSLDQLWSTIVTACRKHNCRNILGIAYIENPTAGDAYDHAEIFDVAGLTTNIRIAWVEQNPEAQDLASFTEAVIRNRGLATGRVFSSEKKARRWLAESAIDAA